MKSVRVIKIFTFILAGLFLWGCNSRNNKPNIKDIEVNTHIERFEKELFNVDIDTIPDAIEYFYNKYDDFFDIFNYYIVDLGRPSDKAYSGYLALFIKDDLNLEVYDYVQKVFPDMDNLEHEFNLAFRYFKYYFPEKDVPELISYISRFSYPYFSVSDYIGIGLDMYLGPDTEFYQRLGIPEYQRQNMFPEKISSDVLGNWANALFPYNDSVDNVLSRIIHEGKLMYFLDKILPDQPDSLKFGFSEDQMNWTRKNEQGMWTYLVENKLIYSTEQMDIRKLVNPAPFTSFFSSESPGRAAVWVGYKIVKEFARRNPDYDLSGIMEEDDYQEILKSSRYNP